MHICKITLSNFRNITDASLEFSPGINCITGNNGAGKTNLLEAVYYLSMTKSCFSASDRFLCRNGCAPAVLCGNYRMDDGCLERISASIGGQSKVFERNGRPYERFSEHIGLIPIVMVSPYDTALVNDSTEERRRYMNSILAQTDKNYLYHIQCYNQLLSRRNKLLKDGEPSGVLLDTFDERMEPHAAYVHNSRKMLCDKLKPVVCELYSALSSGSETVSLEYRSDLDESTLCDLLASERERDLMLRYTGKGIQRDDVVFAIGDYPLRRCGSQGQQKTFLLAMKLAQMSFMKESYGHTPILLLDDVFDKLDMDRVSSLVTLVARSGFGQIFITDSNKVRVSSIVNSVSADCANFVVDNGMYKKLF